MKSWRGCKLWLMPYVYTNLQFSKSPKGGGKKLCSVARGEGVYRGGKHLPFWGGEVENVYIRFENGGDKVATERKRKGERKKKTDGALVG